MSSSGTQSKNLKTAAYYAGGVGLAYLFDWHCPFRAITGHLCPGCGATRAVLALLRGDAAAAWNYNQLIFATPLLLITLWLSRKQNTQIAKAIVIAIAAVLTVGFEIWRWVSPPLWAN